ncbi:polyketide cyclase [Pedobacter yonginense]|uniref:Polyketide cyclase n=1 Tax=Pedobacter yonginense TaxID=651869 RepID=A0A317ETR8_9SPHI|nr:SRPBCC family protein [Pedobacter yonginense]PWS28636.1 polyketide cyclase [Pedobacter yonginense]
MENSASITVKVIVNAPIEKVWEFWTNPEHITQWAFASPDWHAPKAENDLRSGGKFSTTMAARDGSMSFDFGGTYTNVIENKVIEYTIEDGRKVKIVFEGNGDQTNVIETFDPEQMNPREMQQDGWQAILDDFKKYTEEN